VPRGGVPAAVAAAVALLAAGCGGSTGTPSDSTPSLIRKVQPLVVEIITADGLGSGVIWDSDGDIVTNAHVVRGAKKVQVVFANGVRVPGRVRARDNLSDLAVVRIRKTGLRAATFASKLPEVGSPALAIGAPFGYTSSVTTGIVSGVHRTVPPELGKLNPYVDMLQTSAAISPGNSGGALVDSDGEVIGINTAGIPPSKNASNLGFAIPSTTVRAVVDDLMHGRRVNHPYFGARLTDLWPELQRQFQTKARTGALVVEVQPGSPAAHAGIRPGDVITHVAGAKTPNADAFLSALAHKRPGSRVELKLTTFAGIAISHTVVLGDQAKPAKTR
jgi:S1-C subfamily serine protease